MKKIVALMLAVVMLSVLATSLVGCGESEDTSSTTTIDPKYKGLRFETDENGRCVVAGLSYDGTELVIPAEDPDGKKVEGVAEHAFSGNTELVSVTIPEGIEFVSSQAFSGCTALETVVLPESITQIGTYAFNDCSALKEINLPAGLEVLEDSTFENCTALASITLPAGLTTIRYGAFQGCTALTSVTIPAGVTDFEGYAFVYCPLTSVFVVEGNAKYVSAGNCIIDMETKTLVLGTANSVIPSDGSVTVIGNAAFEGRSGLTSIEIPAGVTHIGQGAFGETGLTSVSIPEGVVSVANGAFTDCSSLTSISLPASITEELDYVSFFGCAPGMIIRYAGTRNDWQAIIPNDDRNGWAQMDVIIRCTDGDYVWDW